MLVRIVWDKAGADDMRLKGAALIASLLAPSALMAFTITMWSFAAALHWTRDFFISRGLFSHWEMWLITAASLLLLGWGLNRYAKISNDSGK